MRLALTSATVLIGLSILSAPAGAQRGRRDVAGEFDYYLLSLSLAPSFCASSPRDASNQECERLTTASFQQTPLTIHGLWPNRARVSVNRQPQACDGPQFMVSPEVQERLRRLMPGGPSLARSEWRKHGTCSGLTPDQYFAAAASVAESANRAIGPAILQEGETVHVADLIRTVEATDPALAGSIVVYCRFARGGVANVEEIRLTLDKDLRPIPAASVGLGQNSGCPAGAGRIPPVAS